MTNAREAEAARRSARGEPFVRTLGSETFTFEPEMPLDIVLAYDTLQVASTREVSTWTVAHLLTDSGCDTSCADSAEPFPKRDCPAEKALRTRLRKVRVDGRRLGRDEFDDFYDDVLGMYAVSEGESDSSAESSGAAGEISSETAPAPVLTVQGSGVTQGAASPVSPT